VVLGPTPRLIPPERLARYTSIAIDSNDVVHISYYDATNKDLKYASNMQSFIQTGVGNIIKFIDRDTKVGNEAHRSQLIQVAMCTFPTMMGCLVI
jgi:hypothetical protein